MKPVVLFSGGMDSTTLLHYALLESSETMADCPRIIALSFYYGQRHLRELDAARRIAEDYGVQHQIIDLTHVGQLIAGQSALANPEVPVPEGHYADENMKQTVVPNRNMILLSIAAGFAIANGYDTVAYAAHAGDHTIYPDCRRDFIQPMSMAFRHCDWNPPSLWVPFLDISKTDIYALGMDIGVEFEDTWTCYKGGDTPCGECGACVERREAEEEWTSVNVESLPILPWVQPEPLNE